jgi:hypothetical protein
MMAHTSTPQITDPQTQTTSQPAADRWTQLRTEGSTRIQRIGKILQTAFSETKTEFQAGTEVMKPLAQELSSTVVDNLKETGTKINDAWTDKPGSPDLPTTLKSLLLSFAKTAKATLFPWLKSEAQTLDATLMKHYGDRYGAAKHKVKVAKAWYAQATAPVEVPIEKPPVTVDIVADDMSDA